MCRSFLRFWYNYAMGTREQNFHDKFESASQHLGCTPKELISLKFRGNVGGYHQYQELLHGLQHEAGIHYAPAEGSFQGKGYLVRKSRTKVIIVEHETGLEILYVASSIASLLGLIPTILNFWSWIRDGRNRHHSQ